jgi:hypothetical protein
VDSYQDLNTAKLAEIHELKNQLPVTLGTLIAAYLPGEPRAVAPLPGSIRT